MKVGLKVTTVLGKRWYRQGLAHLVKHLPCQHQDLNLTPKLQVRWCSLVVDYVPEFSQVALRLQLHVCVGPRTYEHIHTYSHKKHKTITTTKN